MMVRTPLLLLTILPVSVHCFAAFTQSTPQHLQPTKTLHHQRPYRTSLSSSNDEEIAALEEKLRRLKEGDGGATEDETPPPAEKPPAPAFEEKRFKISDDSTNVMVTGEEPTRRAAQEPYEELLSEQWKSREGGGGVEGKDLLVKVASAVAVLIGLVAFSQVPIGQEDLDRYSTAKPSMSIDLGDLNPVGEDQQSSY